MMLQIMKRLASSAPLKRVFGRSYSAAAAAAGAVAAASAGGSDVQPTRRRRRITKEQRKAMLESYVNEYRAVNSGKFPTAFGAQKQVGGSYYVIKKLVQELEYQSKMSTTSIKDENIKPENIAEGDKLSNNSEGSSINMTLYENIHQDAKTRDGILLVKEASNPKSLPDCAQVSGSEITVDADSCEDTQKDKETLLIKNFHGEKESTVMEKVSQVQMTLETEIHKDAEVQRDAQTLLVTEAATKIKSSTEVEESSFNQTEKDVVFLENDKSSIINDVDSDTSSANDRLTSTSSEEVSSVEMARAWAASEVITVKGHQLKGEAFSLHPSSDKAEDNVQAETAPVDTREVDRLESGAEQIHHQEKKSETLARDLSKEQQNELQPERKSFMWENLKSLANGIANIWRKL